MPERDSVELLAGILKRSGQEAHISQAQIRRGKDSHHITVLRAGCQTPCVQQLYGMGEVGLGQAMGLGGRYSSSSELDSGATCPMANKVVQLEASEGEFTEG